MMAVLSDKFEFLNVGGVVNGPCSPLLYRPPGSRLDGPAGRPAVFLDRDGVLIEDVDYLTDLSQIVLLPDGVAGVRLLQERFLMIVVTNQSVVARGMLTEAGLQQVHAALARLLGEQGALLDGIYACPHHPTVGDPPYRIPCLCRKPQPGMLLRASADWGVPLGASFMVGDVSADVLAGQRAGVAATALVESPQTGRAQMPGVTPTHVARSLREAAGWILGWDVREVGNG
jgi:D-glycero-D-manno-heptose 1,7-bisphosphate phosphatase